MIDKQFPSPCENTLSGQIDSLQVLLESHFMWCKWLAQYCGNFPILAHWMLKSVKNQTTINQATNKQAPPPKQTNKNKTPKTHTQVQATTVKSLPENLHG